MSSNLNDFNEQLEQSTEQLRQQSEKVEKSKRSFNTLEFKLNNLRQKKTQTEARLNGLNERKYEIEEELNKLEDEGLSEDKITNLVFLFIFLFKVGPHFRIHPILDTPLFKRRFLIWSNLRLREVF